MAYIFFAYSHFSPDKPNIGYTLQTLYGGTSGKSLPYPPLTGYVFWGYISLIRILHAIGPDSLSLHNTLNCTNTLGFNGIFLLMKLFYFPFDLGIALLLVGITGKTGEKFAAALWAFSPVLIYDWAMRGQFDVIPAFFLTLAFFFAKHVKNSWWHKAALLCLSLGGALKIYPLFLVPLFAIILGEGKITKTMHLFAWGLLPFAISVFLDFHSFVTLFVDNTGRLHPLFLLSCAVLSFASIFSRKNLDSLLQYSTAILTLYFVLCWSEPYHYTWITPLLIIAVAWRRELAPFYALQLCYFLFLLIPRTGALGFLLHEPVSFAAKSAFLASSFAFLYGVFWRLPFGINSKAWWCIILLPFILLVAAFFLKAGIGDIDGIKILNCASFNNFITLSSGQTIEQNFFSKADKLNRITLYAGKQAEANATFHLLQDGKEVLVLPLALEADLWRTYPYVEFPPLASKNKNYTLCITAESGTVVVAYNSYNIYSFGDMRLNGRTIDGDIYFIASHALNPNEAIEYGISSFVSGAQENPSLFALYLLLLAIPFFSLLWLIKTP
ncbi:MAG: hypothetical protein QXP42_04555 [Candidatus Micrarchaeia archaeon]